MFGGRSRFSLFDSVTYRYRDSRGAIVTELEELEVTDIATLEETPIEEALALIDKGLGGLTERQLISASEVADLLLDVRSLLSDTSS